MESFTVSSSFVYEALSKTLICADLVNNLKTSSSLPTQPDARLQAGKASTAVVSPAIIGLETNSVNAVHEGL